VNAAASEHLRAVLCRVPELTDVRATLTAAFELFCATVRTDGILYVCGNGGSAADSEHIVGELLKGFLVPRRLTTADQARLTGPDATVDDRLLADNLQDGIRSMALTAHTSIGTAVANDTGAEYVFAQQVYALGRPGDVLWGISTSGNARNVYLAARTARARGMSVVGLTGRSGGCLADVADVTIRVPEAETHLVQELHVPVYHALCAMLEAEFFAV